MPDISFTVSGKAGASLARLAQSRWAVGGSNV